MTNASVLEKLTKFVSKELTDSVGDIAIFKNDNGSYMLFNDYTIFKTDNDDYLVKIGPETVSLSSLKHAVTWCIYDKRHKTSDSVRIVELDQILSSIDISIIIHKRLIKTSKNVEDKLIHLAKLSREQLKRKQVQDQLSQYIIESKRWQEKKFNQER